MKYFSIACILPQLLLGTRFSTSLHLDLFTEPEKTFITSRKKVFTDYTKLAETLIPGSYGDVKVYTNSSGKKFVMKTCKSVHVFFTKLEKMGEDILNETVREYNQKHQKPFQEECNEPKLSNTATIGRILDHIEKKHEAIRRNQMNEIKVLAHINGRGGKYFVAVEGFILTADNKEVTHIIYEHGGIELVQLIIHNNGFPEKGTYISIMKQMRDAVKAFHDCGLIHNDVKGDNFLIDEQGNIRIIDFGGASLNGVLGKVASESYIAPERFEKLNELREKGVDGPTPYAYGEASDIWSLGVCSYGLFTKKYPYDLHKIEGMPVINGDNLLELRPVGWERLDRVRFPPLKQLMQGMLERNVEKRFSMQQIENHEFFNDVVFNGMEVKREDNGFVVNSAKETAVSGGRSHAHCTQMAATDSDRDTQSVCMTKCLGRPSLNFPSISRLLSLRSKGANR